MLSGLRVFKKMNILLDCNNTIENHYALSQEKDDIFQRMSSIIGSTLSVKCSKKDIEEVEIALASHNSNMAWINHVFFWRELLAKFRVLDEERLEYIYEEYVRIYKEKIDIYDDFYIFYEWASSNNCPVSLIANANDKRVRAFIAKFELDKYFHHILISGEMPFKKPDPFMFSYPTKDLGYKYDETIMIGDRYKNDIYGSKRLGIHSVLINRDSLLSQSLSPNYTPDVTVDSLVEASSYIDAVMQKNIVPLYINKEQISSSSIKKVSTALVLAGGRGKRMGDFTKDKQKCMLELNGKPILFYIFRALRNSGVEKIVLALDYLADISSERVNQIANELKIEVVNVKGGFLSTSHAVNMCLEHLGDVFFYCHGNVLFQERLLEKLWEVSHEGQFSTIAITNNADDITHLKVEEFIDGNIVTASLPVGTNDAKFTHLGVSLYRKDLFNNHYIEDQMTESSLIDYLSDGGVVKGYLYDKGWTHLQTEDDYLEVRNLHYWEFAR